MCLSAMVPAFKQNQTSICCLSPEEPSQKIEFVFSASPETIRSEPPEFDSFAQWATCGTWQSAHGIILMFFHSWAGF